MNISVFILLKTSWQRDLGSRLIYVFPDELRAGAEEGGRLIQMNVFDTHAAADQEEFLAKFDDVRCVFCVLYVYEHKILCW